MTLLPHPPQAVDEVKQQGISKNSTHEQAAREFFRQMIQFFARVVELREEKTVIYDGKITVDLPSRGFLEVPNNLSYPLFRLFSNPCLTSQSFWDKST